MLAGLGLPCAVGLPRRGLGAPGPSQYQRDRATYNDPYPDNDIGPPVVGGRPRDFEQQQPEPARLPRVIDRLWSR